MKVKNNAGEEFCIFLDNDKRSCINAKFGKELLASIILAKEEVEQLANLFNEMKNEVAEDN